ncbi:hypothetical protein KUTeg_006975 [Tegillarca granosa]|uniref:Uncharacterized protein n=1 Tax=Tegillarca granosa TaxID=220873 RepID=A0ABQ9FBV8_TEGGR|nr:hypothetical protein KUTeg_006975 [Tegillarca granosa]
MADSSKKNERLLDEYSGKYIDNLLAPPRNSVRESKATRANHYTQGYKHGIKISDGESEKVHVTARCWPSMRKNQPPHTLSIEIDRPNGSITEGHCSCKAGISGIVLMLLLHNFQSVPEQQSYTMVVARPTENRKRKPVLCQIDLNTELPHVTENDIKTLESLTGTPLQSRMSPQVPLVPKPLGYVQIGSTLSYQTKHLRCITEPTTQECGNTSINRTAPVKLSSTIPTFKSKKLIQMVANPKPSTLESLPTYYLVMKLPSSCTHPRPFDDSIIMSAIKQVNK